MKPLLKSLALLVTLSPAVHASPVFHTTQASFNAATAALSFASEDFTSATPGNLSFGTAHAYNGFTATATQSTRGTNNMGFAVYPSGHSGSQHAPFTSSQYLGWSEDTPYLNGNGRYGPTVTLDFTSSVNAISFDFLDSDRTDEYHLLVDGIDIGNLFPSFASNLDADFFFGITDSLGGISSIAFSTNRTSSGGFVEEFGIDNINFSSVASAPNAVPEPTAIALLGLSLVGFGFSRKEKAKVRVFA